MILRISIKKKVTPSKNSKKSLIISSFFISKNVVDENLCIIQYILENKIVIILLANTYTIRYSFMNKEFVEIVCQVF